MGIFDAMNTSVGGLQAQSYALQNISVAWALRLSLPTAAMVDRPPSSDLETKLWVSSMQ